jgi:ubiquinone biosynthesis protein
MISSFNMPPAFLNEAATAPNQDALLQQLHAMAMAFEDEPFRKTAAEALVARANPADIIPETYREYRSIVHDGLICFLSKLSPKRLVSIVAAQIMMPDQSCGAERLLSVAKSCPTLHKLGQIIARNNHIDPEIRNWFVPLENGNYGTKPETIRPHIEKQIQAEKDWFSIQLGTGILSEASVGAVYPFCWRDTDSGDIQNGVFKVLKPGVPEQLSEELQVLEELAVFFQQNAQRYCLNDFNYIELFKDIRDALAEETDLLGEQSHLWDAYQFYSDTRDVQIPELAPFSNHAVTAMSFLEGEKVTEAHLPVTARNACARLLFNNLILKPIFSRSASAIFHGDPHAGNILAQYDPKSGKTRIGLVDWSLAGHLSKAHRIGVLQLIQSVIKGETPLICRSIMALSAPEATPPMDGIPSGWADRVSELMRSPEYSRANLVHKAFRLVDQAARSGILFHPNLLLFRKSLFTLEGILNELDPHYDIDDMLVRYLTVLLIGELPKRFGCLLFPGFDTPENFRSLMSNKDLRSLFLYHAIEFLKTGVSLLREIIQKHVPMAAATNVSSFFNFPEILSFAKAY